MPTEFRPHKNDEPHLTPVLREIFADNGGQFFVSVPKVLPYVESSLPYFLANFRMELYSPELFERHAIDFPPHIRNSVVKRQAEFFAGRMCARSILDAYGYGHHVVKEGTHREPVWPQGFIGSITHNACYAAAIACPIATIVGIGIDIESIIMDDARHAMIDLVVCAEEAEYLRAHSSDINFDSMLTLVFSAKESFFKAAFPQVGAYFDFDAVKVFDINQDNRTIRFQCNADLSENLKRGQIHQAHFDFIGSTSILTAVLLKHSG